MGPNALLYAVIGTVVVSGATLVWVLFDQRKQRILYEERVAAYEKEQEELAAAEALKAAERERARAAAEAAGIPFIEEEDENEEQEPQDGEEPVVDAAVDGDNVEKAEEAAT